MFEHPSEKEDDGQIGSVETGLNINEDRSKSISVSRRTSYLRPQSVSLSGLTTYFSAENCHPSHSYSVVNLYLFISGLRDINL